MDAEQHFGQPQGERGVVRSHSIGAGEREFQAPSQREAVQGRNGGAGQIRERLQNGLSGAHQLVTLLGGADLQKFLDVGARTEAACLGRANHHSDRAPGGYVGKLRGQIAKHRRGQNIGRSPGRVAHHPGHAVRVDFQGPGESIGHQAACRAWLWIVKSQINGR
jgi:hypothetical protein